MRRSGNRIGVCAVTLAVAGSVLAVAPQPAGASYYSSGVSFSRRIVRGSVPYRLKVRAIEAMGFSYRLEVSISKVRDPAGVTALRQRQTWAIPLEEGDFYQEGDTYYIRAGAEGSAFHVDIAVERREGVRCGDRGAMFVSETQDGAFEIQTGNGVFGTITELPECGRTWSHSSGQIPGPPRCPLPGQRASASSVTVRERRGDDWVRVAISDSRTRDVAGGPVEWSVGLRGTVPEQRFRLTEDLEGGLRSGGAPWLDGRARIRSERPLRRNAWFDCRGDREARTEERRVSIRGNLELDVIGFEALAVRARRAHASRSWVRPRT